MASFLASIDGVAAKAAAAWRPPLRLSLSEWADREFVLSAESAAEPGRWRTIPYQRGILDAFSDPNVEKVSCMKSARIGWTKIINILAAYSVAQDPCPVLIVQPTIEDSEGYSKEEIEPMMRDVPALARVIPDPNGPGQTLTHKKFPGGSLSFIGANSPRGFRRVSRKIVLFDETDGYPPSAGDEGDQIKLGIKRTEYYWDRKIGAGSTPTIAGVSRIEKLFNEGDQRRYYVPCPTCGHQAPFVFRGEDGHSMKWSTVQEDGRSRAVDVHFVCQDKGCRIEHHQKRLMIERGEWRAAKPFRRHASFHIWAAYSYSPNATWEDIANEFLAASAAGTEELKTFVNTTLGEVWQEKGEAPDWQRLYDRREHYTRATVPAGVLFITMGVDVQRDRLVYEVVGWGDDKQSWSVDVGVLPGDPAAEQVWSDLDALLNTEWPTANGGTTRVKMLAVDSGDNTNAVYTWGRKHPANRVIAIKGKADARTLIGAPTPVDVRENGRRIARGYKVWPVGVDIAKGEFYGQLRLPKPTVESGAPFPPGYCHHPEYGEDYFKQITAEHLVKVTKKSGHVRYEWQVLAGRENHYLDCRVYARAAAMLCGLDRIAAAKARKKAPHVDPILKPGAAEVMAQTAAVLADAAEKLQDRTAPPPSPQPRPKRQGSWLSGGRGAISGSGWLGRRR